MVQAHLVQVFILRLSWLKLQKCDPVVLTYGAPPVRSLWQHRSRVRVLMTSDEWQAKQRPHTRPTVSVPLPFPQLPRLKQVPLPKRLKLVMNVRPECTLLPLLGLHIEGLMGAFTPKQLPVLWPWTPDLQSAFGRLYPLCTRLCTEPPQLSTLFSWPLRMNP